MSARVVMYVLVSSYASPGSGMTATVYAAQPDGRVWEVYADRAELRRGVWDGDGTQVYGETQMAQWLADMGAREARECTCGPVTADRIKRDNGLRCRECGEWFTGSGPRDDAEAAS